MNVLVYTTVYPNPEDPGRGTFLRSRTLGLARRPGVNVRVVAPVPYFPSRPRIRRWHRYSRIPPEEWRDGIHVLHPRYLVTPRIGMRYYASSLLHFTLASVRNLLRSFPADVIDAHCLYPDGLAAVRLGRRLGIPVVVSARGTDTHTYPELRGIRPLLRRTLRGAARAVAVSEDLARRMQALAPQIEPPAVIPNGVDTRRFHPLDRRSARRETGIPPGSRVVMAVGRLIPVKGHEVLLRAWRGMGGGGERACLVLVGDGDGRGRLERSARALGIDRTVRFAGEVPQEHLVQWYNSADVFCLPSLREGCPNALLEAMACGIPAVASRTGGVPELLDGEGLGLLVEPGDPQALGRALARALGSEWDAASIAARAAGRSWEHAAEQVEEVLRRAHEDPVSP